MKLRTRDRVGIEERQDSGVSGIVAPELDQKTGYRSLFRPRPETASLHVFKETGPS